MKTELTCDDMSMLDYNISGNLRKLAAEKEIIHQKLGEEFAIIKKDRALRKKCCTAR